MWCAWMAWALMIVALLACSQARVQGAVAHGSAAMQKCSDKLRKKLATLQNLSAPNPP
jgi:hypothetical protein